MADEEFPREDELESRQAAALYPVGRALRKTYDAENHDSLGTDITGLMLELARIDPDASLTTKGPTSAPPIAPALVPSPPEHLTFAPPPKAPAPISWWRIAMGRLLAR